MTCVPSVAGIWSTLFKVKRRKNAHPAPTVTVATIIIVTKTAYQTFSAFHALQLSAAQFQLGKTSATASINPATICLTPQRGSLQTMMPH